MLTLALDVFLGQGDLRLAVRDAEDLGELVGTALQLSLETASLRVGIGSIDLWAISGDSEGGIVAVAAVDAIKEGIDEASFVGGSRGIGQIVNLVNLHLLGIDQRRSAKAQISALKWDNILGYPYRSMSMSDSPLLRTLPGATGAVPPSTEITLGLVPCGTHGAWFLKNRLMS